MNPNKNQTEAAPAGGRWHYYRLPSSYQIVSGDPRDTLGTDLRSIASTPGATDEDAAHADLICRAVNSHAALVRALRRMMNTHGAHGPCSGNDCRDCGAAYQQARAVLASVEGRR